MRVGITTRVLLHLHRNDVADSQLADRINPPKIHHPGLRAVGNHAGMTGTGSKINLVGSGIDPIHRPHDLAPGRLTGPAGKGSLPTSAVLLPLQPASAVKATARVKLDAA